MNITNIFWKIPESVTDFFKPKGKTSITFTAYKVGDGWYFNYPPITWMESLVFTKAMDEIAKGKNKIKMTITTYKVDGAEKAWKFQDDPIWMEATEYYWKDHMIWICPWAQWYFGHKPDNFWFTVE